MMTISDDGDGKDEDDGDGGMIRIFVSF